MSSKFMSAEDFAEWAEHHTLQEVEQKVIEQEAQLREELLESSGNTFEEFQAATQQGRDQMLEQGGAAWLAEDEHKEHQAQAAEIAADSDEQRVVQEEFCRRHPSRFPSQSNGDLFTNTYVDQWQEENPGLPVFWEIGAMEAVFAALESQGAFEVSRIYKSK